MDTLRGEQGALMWPLKLERDEIDDPSVMVALLFRNEGAVVVRLLMLG